MMSGKPRKGEYSRIRTTFELQFRDGSKQYLEVAPQGVFGISIEAHRNGNKARNHAMFVAAESDLAYDDQQGHKHYFVTRSGSVSADTLKVKVQLGRTEQPLVKARVTRFGYDSRANRWVQLGDPVNADTVRRVSTKLNAGAEREAIWKRSWRDGDVLLRSLTKIASKGASTKRPPAGLEKVEGSYGEIKTVIELQFASPKSGNTPPLTRTIEMSAL
jgi:hypothetical protein